MLKKIWYFGTFFIIILMEKLLNFDLTEILNKKSKWILQEAELN